MTPQAALRAQIEKNRTIMAVVRTNKMPGITMSREGQDFKTKELTEINEGLSEALKLLGPDG